MENTLQRIKKYIDSIGVSVHSFEKKVGFSNGAFASQLKNNKTIGVDKLENILKEYDDLSADWLIRGDGAMLKGDLQKHNKRNFKLLPLLPVEAFAGKGLGAFQDLKIERTYQIHEFRSADFLLRVKGNSMYPKYSSGDILACALIESRLFFQWNRPHVLYTNSQGLMVKRVRKSKKPDHILCVSDNENYDPFDVPVDDIVDIALVCGAIRLE